MLRFVLHALLALSAASIAGCWPLFTPEPAPTASPSQASADYRYSVPPTQVTQSPERHKSVKRSSTKTAHASAPDHTSSEAAVSSAPEAPAPSLTLDGETTSRAQAQQLVETADRSLARINKSKLTGNDVSTYDQASDFVSSAQRALDDNDYFEASGFAQKASTLTSRLAQ
jgi:cytoskeletal protein RodZ